MIQDTSRLASDFARFCDPATKLNINDRGRIVDIEIIRNGDERRYSFDVTTGMIEKLGPQPPRKFRNFASLLASSEFSDLNSFRETQRRILSEKVTDFLEPAGSILSAGGAEFRELDVSSVVLELNPSSGSKLKCVLIDGAAGVGKTTLLEHLALLRTQDSASVPIFHVTSRGRRLTNLRDAFAGTITNLRAKFVPDEIPILVRYGLLQVALDGFDEFVDPSGYADAWAALKDFVRECEAAGPLILAGRDTFFDQQGFTNRLSGTAGGVEIATIRLREVEQRRAIDWLKSGGWNEQDAEGVVTRNYLKPGSYMLRPFFLARIRKLGGWDGLRESQMTPQSYLISEMLEREARLLEASLSMRSSDIVVILERLFEDIAEDMCEREVDTVPLHYLRFVAEYSFSGALPKDAIARLYHSLGSLALIERSDAADEVRFPHSEIGNQFLIRRLIRYFVESEIPGILTRTIIGLDRAEAFAERMAEVTEEDFIRIAGTLERALREGGLGTRASTNCASLAISSLSHGSDHPLQLEHVDAADARIVQTGGAARVREANIIRLDVRDADLTAVEFLKVNVGTLIVNNSTKFRESTINVSVLQEKRDNSVFSMRNPGEITRWIAAHTESDNSGVGRFLQSPLLKHFDRICRKFSSQIYVRDNPDDRGSFLLRGEMWDDIRRVLEANNRLSIERKTTAGTPDPFYFIDRPEELLSPGNEDSVSYRIRAEIAALGRRKYRGN